MADRVKVFALGGLDENGRDCYIVEVNDDIFVIDAGNSIPDKNLPGIDCLLPNTDYLIKNKERIAAYIMTHGHDENIAALKYFYKKAPAMVYCTETTKEVIEGQMLMHQYYVKINYKVINPSDDVVIRGRKVRFFQTCHNAAGSFGVAIETDQGNVVFTSDFIFSFTTEETQYRFDLMKSTEIAKSKTLLLMAESKNAQKVGYCSPKHRIHDLVEKNFAQDKRIFICCYWQNMYRIREIVRLGKANKKKFYFYDSYTSQVMDILINANAGINLTDADIVKKEDLLRCKNTDLVILMLGNSADIFDEINALAFNRNSDSRLRVTNEDIFINVAVPRPLYETAATRAMDNLYRTGCQVVWLKGKNVSAMHACEDDLRFIINLFRPQYYFPVRGHYIELMENAKNAVELGLGLNYMNTFVLDNGMQIIFEAGKRPMVVPAERTGIELSPVLVDGNGIATMTSDIIETRQKMGVDGAVIVAATVSLKDKKIIYGPDCQMRGFVYVKEAEPLLKSVTQIFIEEVQTALNNNATDFTQAKALIVDRTERFIKRQNGRKPFVDPIILVEA